MLSRFPENIRAKLKLELRCTISISTMINPALGVSGHSYERESLEDWTNYNNREPLTGMPQTKADIWSNFALQFAIAELNDPNQIPLYDRYSNRLDQDIQRLQNHLIEASTTIALIQQNNTQEVQYVFPIWKWEYAFLCPLTGTILRNPVTVESGITYERDAITREHEAIDINSGNKIRNYKPRPNRRLKNIIDIIRTTLFIDPNHVSESVKEKAGRLRFLINESHKLKKIYDQISADRRRKKIIYQYGKIALGLILACKLVADNLEEEKEVANPSDVLVPGISLMYGMCLSLTRPYMQLAKQYVHNNIEALNDFFDGTSSRIQECTSKGEDYKNHKYCFSVLLKAVETRRLDLMLRLNLSVTQVGINTIFSSFIYSRGISGNEFVSSKAMQDIEYIFDLGLEKFQLAFRGINGRYGVLILNKALTERNFDLINKFSSVLPSIFFRSWLDSVIGSAPFKDIDLLINNNPNIFKSFAYYYLITAFNRDESIARRLLDAGLHVNNDVSPEQLTSLFFTALHSNNHYATTMLFDSENVPINLRMFKDISQPELRVTYFHRLLTIAIQSPAGKKKLLSLLNINPEILITAFHSQSFSMNADLLDKFLELDFSLNEFIVKSHNIERSTYYGKATSWQLIDALRFLKESVNLAKYFPVNERGVLYSSRWIFRDWLKMLFSISIKNNHVSLIKKLLILNFNDKPSLNSGLEYALNHNQAEIVQLIKFHNQQKQWCPKLKFSFANDAQPDLGIKSEASPSLRI